MPVFLVNADPAYPFTRIVRQHGLDLYEDWRPLPAVADYCGLHDAAAEAERRPLWGYWPRTLNGNKALLRSHLDEIVLAASADRPGAQGGSEPSGYYVWLALASEHWLKERSQPQAQQQQQQRADDGPLDRGVLEYLRAQMDPPNEAAVTRPSQAKLAGIYNLSRVVAIPTQVDPGAEMQACAFALVEDRLVDSVVFLVHHPAMFQDRDRLTFAALRLVGAALEDAEVFRRFRAVAGVPTARVYIDNDFLQPTQSDRRVDFLKRVLLEADAGAGDAHATGALAGQARKLCTSIEQDMKLVTRPSAEEQHTRAARATSRLYVNVPENPCKNPATAAAFESRWVAVPAASAMISTASIEFKQHLAAHLHDVQDHWFNSSRSTALEWSRDDKAFTDSISALSSGTSGTRERDLADLQEVRREVARIVADAAREQRQAREELRPSVGQIEKESAGPMFRPISVKSPDGSGREITATGPTTEYGTAASRLLEAEGGRFAARPAVLITMLFAITLTISTSLAVMAIPGARSARDILRALSLDPATVTGIMLMISLVLLAIGLTASFYRKISRLAPLVLAAAFAITLVVTVWQFSEALEQGGTFAEALSEIGWHPLAPLVLFLEFGFIVAMGTGAARARRRFVNARVKYEMEAEQLKGQVLAGMAQAKTYGANHFAIGWLRALDARIDELEIELSRTEPAQRVQAEIKSWPGSQARVELSEEDKQRITSLAEDLVGTTRARWVLRTARAFPAPSGNTLKVTFTGLAEPVRVPNAIFVHSAPTLSFDVRQQ
jgi:hypothetical protein